MRRWIDPKWFRAQSGAGQRGGPNGARGGAGHGRDATEVANKWGHWGLAKEGGNNREQQIQCLSLSETNSHSAFGSIILTIFQQIYDSA